MTKTKPSKNKPRPPTNAKIRDTITALFADSYTTILQKPLAVRDGKITLDENVSFFVNVDDWTDGTCSVSVTALATKIDRIEAIEKLADAQQQVRSLIMTYAPRTAARARKRPCGPEGCPRTWAKPRKRAAAKKKAS